MSTMIRRLSMAIVLIILLMGGIRAEPVRAGTPIFFTVDSFADANDYAINSVCNVDLIIGGPCTLRAAINEANLNGDYSDIVINIPAGNYDLTIPPAGSNDIKSGDLNFFKTNPGYTIYLVGTGAQPAIIDAQQLDRVLRISPDVNVSLENIVIRGGLLSWTGAIDYPDGAGILNYGNLNLAGVTIEENEAKCGQASCAFQIAGGGILNLGKVIMTDSIIRNNISEAASAIFTSGIEDEYFFMKNSTISGNQSKQAAVIINYAYLHIRNSTIAGNTASSSFFSGILNHDALVLEFSTIVNAGMSSSVYNAAEGSVTIQNSIMKNVSSPGGYNCLNYGSWVSNGYNLYSDATCPVTGTGDLGSTDPKLGPLGAWGGPTLTVPLLTGSPALNHRMGSCTTIPESPVVTT